MMKTMLLGMIYLVVHNISEGVRIVGGYQFSFLYLLEESLHMSTKCFRYMETSKYDSKVFGIAAFAISELRAALHNCYAPDLDQSAGIRNTTVKSRL